MTKAEKNRVQKEIVDGLKPNPHGRLIIPMRFGKTKIAIDIIKRDKPSSILWVTPSAKLADEDIPKEFATWKAKRFIKKLTTTTYTSLPKVRGHYDMIILDEDQSCTPHNMEVILDSTLSWRNILGMTGTDTGHEDKQEIFRQLSLEKLVDMSVTDGVDIGVLSDYMINVIEVDLSQVKDIEAGKKGAKFLTSEAGQYEYLNRMANRAIWNKTPDIDYRIMARMHFIKGCRSKLTAAKWLVDNLQGRKLIFSSNIKQCENLSLNTYHSKTDNVKLQQFIAGEIDEIAMVNKGGTGFTYKGVDHLIITQCDSDKNGLTSQKIGRILLKQKNHVPIVWIVVLLGTQDSSWVNKALTSFDESKVKWYRYINLVNDERSLREISSREVSGNGDSDLQGSDLPVDNESKPGGGSTSVSRPLQSWG